LNSIEPIAIPPNVAKVATSTRRYSSAPLPMMRVDRERAVANASIHSKAITVET
jgi:hypothetical protein